MTVEQIAQAAREAGMNIYVGAPEEDDAMVQLWLALKKSGDIDLVIPKKEAQGLSAFLMWLRASGNTVAYVYDEGIIALAVLEPFAANAAMFSYWMAPQLRKAKRGFKVTQFAYTLAMEQYAILIGMTRESLVDEHKKVGYTVIDRDTYVTDKETVIVKLNRAAFADSPLNLKRGDTSVE